MLRSKKYAYHLSMPWVFVPAVLLFVGIRGQLQVNVKLDLFSDLNKFRQSSCGVKFFCSTFHLLYFSAYKVQY